MTLNPNRFKLAFKLVLDLWEKNKHKEDLELVVVEIAVATSIEIASICMIIEYFCKETRLEETKIRIIDYYKYDIIVPMENYDYPIY